MMQKFLIALACLGALCCTTDTQASGNALKVRVDYLFSGWTSVHNTFSITCSSGPDCAVNGTFCDQDHKCVLGISLPKALVQALPAVARTDLKPVSEPVEVMGPTDHDPRWDVQLQLDSGALHLLNTSSHVTKGVWNVQQSGRWAVQETDAFDRAFKAVLEPIFKGVKGGCRTT